MENTTGKIAIKELKDLRDDSINDKAIDKLFEKGNEKDLSRVLSILSKVK